MKLNLLKLNIPINFNFIILKKFNKNVIIVFNNKFKFKFFLKNINNLKINKNLNSIEYKNNNLNKNYYTLNNMFYRFLEKLNNYYFLKIKLSKYKFILLKNNFNILKNICYKIIKIKKINEYTNRGLRLTRQIIIKRKGKKGSFV